MLKKTFAAAAVVAGALLFAGASAAQASTNYPATVTVTAASSALEVGGATVVTATFENTEYSAATFTVSPTDGASLSAIVRTATSVESAIVDGKATTNFTGTTAGTYTVTASTPDSEPKSVTITVAAAGAGAGTGGGSNALPSTGGQIPAAALWGGAGAIGLGALAVVAATARRRAAQR